MVKTPGLFYRKIILESKHEKVLGHSLAPFRFLKNGAWPHFLSPNSTGKRKGECKKGA